MSSRILKLVFVLAIPFLGANIESRAADILGQVGSVDDKKIAILISGAADPKVGDKFGIFVEVPGVGNAKIASGSITQVEGGFVFGEISESTGKPAMGHRVRIESALSTNPVPSSSSSTPASSPPPNSTPSPAIPANSPPPSQPPPSMPSAATTSANSDAGRKVKFPELSFGPMLVPTETEKEAIKLLVDTLVREHLSAHPLDDEIAHRTIRLFVDYLDQSHAYFRQSDLDEFLSRHAMFDDQIRQANLSPAFEIYRVLLGRMKQIEDVQEALIRQPFNFEEEDWLDVITLNTPFANSDDEAMQRWSKFQKYWMLAHLSAGRKESEAKELVLKSRRAFHKRYQAFTSEDVVEGLGESLSDAFDPQSNFALEKTAQNREIELAGTMVGVGLQLQIHGDYAVVNKIIAGSPSEKTKRFNKGDRVVGVAEGKGEFVDVVGMPLGEIVGKIRGPKETTVRIRAIPAGDFEAFDEAIQRGSVNVSSFGFSLVGGELFPERPAARLGYIYLPSFYRAAGTDPNRLSTTKDLQRAIAELKKQNPDALVIDLCNNGGGALIEALDVCGLFIGANQTVIQTRYRGGETAQHSAKQTSLAWDGTTVVLTSRFGTGGGAEILAGAVKDYQRGLIVGMERTTGAGVIGSAFNLLPPGAPANSKRFGTTVVGSGKFYRANGEGMQLKGIGSDIVVPSLESLFQEEYDAKPFSLKFDSVASATFTPSTSGPAAEWKERLSNQSSARRSKQPWFQQLDVEIRKSKERGGKTSLRLSDYMASQKSRLESNGVVPPIPGVPEVELSDLMREKFNIALDYASLVHSRKAEQLQSQRQFTNAVTSWERAVATDPENMEAHYLYAWLLGTCSDASIRNGNRAVQLAAMADTKADHQSWRFALCLAIAKAEARDFDAALAQLKKAFELTTQEKRQPWAYLEERFKNKLTYQPKS